MSVSGLTDGDCAAVRERDPRNAAPFDDPGSDPDAPDDRSGNPSGERPPSNRSSMSTSARTATVVHTLSFARCSYPPGTSESPARPDTSDSEASQPALPPPNPGACHCNLSKASRRTISVEVPSTTADWNVSQ